METLAKLSYAADHYLRALALLIAVFGAGDLVTTRLHAVLQGQLLTRVVLACATGMALLILAILALGLAGGFHAASLGALIAAAFALGLYRAGRLARALWSSSMAGDEALRLREVPWWIWLAIAAASARYLIRPLNPPIEWDELMYHLPYVRFWADAGNLAVDQTLRYPLFPYSYHMLYVAAYMLGSDVLTHLVHGMAGWLTTLLVLAVGLRHFGPAVALLAAVLYPAAVGVAMFSSAYIDLALTFFVSASMYALHLAYQHKRTGFLYLSALCIGTAIGIKYHALVFAVFWGLLLLLIERRPRRILLAGAIVAAACGYWYARNFVVSGDPFHPIGARVFGFYLWDEKDLADQLSDVKKAIELPLPLLWVPALLSVLLWRTAAPLARWLVAFAAFSVATWVLTSGLSRYLMPAYPALAILAAIALVRAGEWLGQTVAWGRWVCRDVPGMAFGVRLAFVLVVAAYSAPQALKAWNRIATSQAARDRFLADRLSGYTLSRQLAADPTIRLFQVGFEGQFYYLPPQSIGDHFGPGRYRTIHQLARDPKRLAAHIQSLGANAIAIDDTVDLHHVLRFPPDMSRYFDLAIQTPSVRVYRLKAAG